MVADFLSIYPLTQVGALLPTEVAERLVISLIVESWDVKELQAGVVNHIRRVREGYDL